MENVARSTYKIRNWAKIQRVSGQPRRHHVLVFQRNPRTMETWQRQTRSRTPFCLQRPGHWNVVDDAGTVPPALPQHRRLRSLGVQGHAARPCGSGWKHVSELIWKTDCFPIKKRNRKYDAKYLTTSQSSDCLCIFWKINSQQHLFQIEMKESPEGEGFKSQNWENKVKTKFFVFKYLVSSVPTPDKKATHHQRRSKPCLMTVGDMSLKLQASQVKKIGLFP
jgi:hypothetical protein